MNTSRLNISGDLGGIAMNSSVSRSAAGKIGHIVMLGGAVNGVISSSAVGPPPSWTVTLGEHGFDVGDSVDVYWLDGGERQSRHSLTVDAVDGNDIELVDDDGAGGTTMPEDSTEVTVSPATTLDSDFAGGLIEMIGAIANRDALLGFHTSDHTRVLSIALTARELWFWSSGGTSENPIDGHEIDYIRISHSHPDDDGFRLGLLYNSDQVVEE